MSVFIFKFSRLNLFRFWFGYYFSTVHSGWNMQAVIYRTQSGKGASHILWIWTVQYIISELGNEKFNKQKYYFFEIPNYCAINDGNWIFPQKMKSYIVFNVLMQFPLKKQTCWQFQSAQWYSFLYRIQFCSMSTCCESEPVE